MTMKSKIRPPSFSPRRFPNVSAAFCSGYYAKKQQQVAPIPYSSITSKASEIPNSRSSNLMKLGNPSSASIVVIIPDSSEVSEITNSPSSNLMELGNPSSVAPVPDSSTTSEALEVPKSPDPNLMEFGNPSSVHLADGLIIQAAAQSPKNGANFDCLVSREKELQEMREEHGEEMSTVGE
ncbi:uncharacterized protein LOC122047996 isoform X4 [Zingiber officinale]|uniref:uncharacterized protein LOC122047996 isoform X4 n=1 Tax=Zingiber officinale TaxID=94328 RepID=UPI001C4CB21A|nr:uncharacterized protein LOC122047996 isoform X4 [Zingiber officinale]